MIASTGLLLAASLAVSAGSTRVDPSDTAVVYKGRVDSTNRSAPILSWSGSGATLRFSGTSCQVVLAGKGVWWRVDVDGVERAPLRDAGTSSDTTYTLATGLAAGPHTVELTKRTEASSGSARLKGFLVDGVALPPIPRPLRRLQLVGNSITCGYGDLDSSRDHHFSLETEDFTRTYGALTARAFGAEIHGICVSGIGVYRNGDSSLTRTMPERWESSAAFGSTSSWSHANWQPDAVVIDLGTNDFAYIPFPDSTAFQDKFFAFLERIRQVHPKTAVVLLDGPMLSDGFPGFSDGTPGRALSRVRAHMASLAARQKGRGFASVSTLSLTPQSEAVGYGGDWHPNRVQHALNAKELVAHLSRVLGWDTTKTVGIAAARPLVARAAIRREGDGWAWEDPSPVCAWIVSDTRGRTVARGTGARVEGLRHAAGHPLWIRRSDGDEAQPLP